VYDEVAAAFATAFGRLHPAVEAYRADDAEVVFFMIGSFATKARDAVDRLRDAGQAVGLVRPRLLRPYPLAAVRRLLCGRRAVAVIDQNLSFGMGGILHTELAAALYGQPGAPLLASFIAGLGGRDVAPEEFFEIAAVARRAAERGVAPEPRLLYTGDELRAVRALQAIALAERTETTR
jgi:pyruvate ferredoxin oxidoreductase alpha subunit